MHRQTMQSNLIAGGIVRGPRQNSLCDGVGAPGDDALINDVSGRPMRARSTPSVRLRGGTGMSGLISAHPRFVLGGVNPEQPGDAAPTPLAANVSVATPAIISGRCLVTYALERLAVIGSP
jgi:hypothetical protein